MCYECENSSGPYCYDDMPFHGDVEYDGPIPNTFPATVRGNVHRGQMVYFDSDMKTMQEWHNEIQAKKLEQIQKEQRVTTTLADRKAALQRQQEELAIRLEKLSRIPSENPFREGDVGKLTKVFPSGESQGYTYAFLYVGGVFYTTGTRSNTQKFYSWDQFANWIGEGTWKIEKASAWDNVSA